jgi:hypothetical protein
MAVHVWWGHRACVVVGFGLAGFMKQAFMSSGTPARCRIGFVMEGLHRPYRWRMIGMR